VQLTVQEPSCLFGGQAGWHAAQQTQKLALFVFHAAKPEERRSSKGMVFRPAPHSVAARQETEHEIFQNLRLG
jgi:hypothetical protein